MKNSYSSLFLMAVPLAFFACKGSTTGTGGSGGTGGNNVTSTSGKTGTTSTGLSTTTTTNVGQTTTTSVTSSSGGPITCSNAYTNIPNGGCDLLQQDCTNGNTCAVFQGTGGNSSVSMCDTNPPGLKAAGSPCTVETECDKGLFCVADVCTPVCCPDMGSGQNCGGGTCNLTLTFTGTTDFVTVCDFSPQCTLFAANACTSPAQCHPTDGLATCSQPSGANIAEGGVCVAVNDCGDMQACIGPQAGPYNCRYVCTPGSTAAMGLGGCPANQTCQASTTFNIPNLGICTPN